MIQYLIDFPVINFLGAPFTELVIFVLLMVYVVIRRHDKRLAGVSRLKIFILLIVFVYFAWMPIVWPSLIPSSMLTLSVFGMFAVNFYFLYSLILARIEWPYRQRLANLAQEPANQEIFPPSGNTARDSIILIISFSLWSAVPIHCGF